MPDTARILLNVFDGTRAPISSDTNLLVTISDGNQKQVERNYHKGPSIGFEVDVFDNLGDRYAVIAYADNHSQAGFTPVKVARNATSRVDLMLLPKEGTFRFDDAAWPVLQQTHPKLFEVLSAGVTSAQAEERYNQLMQQEPAKLAALLNITTAMSAIHLRDGTAMDFMKQMIWDELAQDRFFGYADKRLIGEIIEAGEKMFKPEFGTSFFHKGATRSWKQVQFGEANVQLTFHENDETPNPDWVKIEPDIDYYQDIGAHALLEVLPNTATGGKTDPRTVYVLRWIAGRQAGIVPFNPPYIIA
ncbi:MAG TPA: hypothetical protein VJH03_09515 [Blastocatellia bacterium]|nr:hypothetical protein [Blastocatellia bacterium]